MNNRLYAYRETDDQIDLYVSEAGKLPPSDYTICSLDDFREAWRLRDTVRIRQLYEAVQRSK